MRPRINIFKQLFSLVFGEPVRVNNTRPIRNFIDQFDYNEGIGFTDRITDIKVYFQEPHYFYLIVRIHKPGLIIGKQGKTLENLKGYIADRLDGVVPEIYVEEEKMFKQNNIRLGAYQEEF